MWDTADLATLIDPALPGYTLGTKADLSTVGGLFRNAAADVFGLVSGTNPSFLCSPASAPAIGQSITLLGTLYTVTGSRPDGMGLARLELEKQ